jgi:hypothetical protein
LCHEIAPLQPSKKVSAMAAFAPTHRLTHEASLKMRFIVKSCGCFSTDFDQLSAVDVVAVGMWATRLRCPSCP